MTLFGFLEEDSKIRRETKVDTRGFNGTQGSARLGLYNSIAWVLFARLLMVEVFEDLFVYLEDLTGLKESIWGEVYGV